MREPKQSQASSAYPSLSAYAKAGIAFVATTATYFFARTSGVLPTWLQWGSDTSAQGGVTETVLPVETSSDLPEIKATQRRLLQTNCSVTVVNPIPDQVIEATVEYSYDLSNVFAGDYTQLGLSQSSGAEAPSWLNYEPKFLGSYAMSDVARGVHVIGPVAYVADGSSGLQILNVSYPTNVTRLGSYDTQGFAYGVQVIGTVAYVADYTAGLQILNVSNLANISRLGGYDTSGAAYEIQIIGTLAYVADYSSGLQILNVSNPANVSRLGSYDTPGQAYGVQVIGTIAYVADGFSGLQILNVSNANNISLLGNYSIIYSAYGVQVIGTVAYLANGFAGLQILNVSNPANVTGLGGYDTPGLASGVQVIGNIAYVADASSGLQILDVSNPVVVKHLGGYNTPGNAGEVQVSGTVAYLADADYGLQIVDLAQGRLVGTPTTARVGDIYVLDVNSWLGGQWCKREEFQLTVARFPRRVDTSLSEQSVFPNQTLRVFWDSDILFTDVSGNALQLSVTLTPLTMTASATEHLVLSPSLMGSYPTLGAVQGVQVIGTVAYVAEDNPHQLEILDVSNPATISRLGNYNTLGAAQDIQVIGKVAYVANSGVLSLRILNVSNPVIVGLLGSYAAPSGALGVQVIDTVAYIADDAAGLQILNVSNPVNVSCLGGYDTPGSALGVEVINTVAYVADGSSGLQILNVSNLANVSRLGGYDTPDMAYGVQIVGSVAYVADFTSGLQILNLSNPTNVSRLGGYDTPGNARKVQVIGTMAYVADDIAGLQILNVRNPANVSRLGGYDTPGSAYEVQVIGTVAYVADYDAGLQILDLTTWEWTVSPTVAEVGNYEVTLTATNALGGSASDQFLLRVEGPPQIHGAIPFQYAKVGQVFNYFIPQELITDPNLDVIQFSAALTNQTILPSWLAFNGISATFAGTPGNGDVGNYSVTVTATDNIAGALVTQFRLYVDHKPVLNRALSRQVANIGAGFNYTFLADTFVDADNDSLTYTASRADGSALPAWLNFNSNLRRFTGTPAGSDAGSDNLVIVASDPYQGRARADFTLAVGHAPTVSQTLLAPLAGVDRAYNWALSSQAFSDVDDAVLSYSASLSDGSALPGWLRFQSGALVFSGTPSSLDRGQLRLRITATDALGLSAAQVANLTVTSFPKLMQPITDQVVIVEEPYQFAVASTVFNEPDGEPLSYQLLDRNGGSLPVWLVFNASQPSLSGTPNVTSRTRYDWSLVASDPFGASDNSDFSLLAQHRPALVGSLIPPTAGAGQAYHWTIPAAAIVDVDGDILRYALASANQTTTLPSWLHFDASTRTLSGTPATTDLGNVSLQLTVSDPYVNISLPLMLTVSFIPEVIAPIAAPPVLRSGFSFNMTINLTATFRDLDDSVLIYTATTSSGSALPPWLIFDTTSGRLSGTPDDVDVGVLPLQIVATDASSNHAEAAFTLTIEPNYAPELYRAIDNYVAEVDQPFELILPSDTFVDRNGDVITYSAHLAGRSDLPDWLRFEALTLRFSGTPRTGDTNSLSDRDLDMVLSASDGRQSTQTGFRITVQGSSALEGFLKIGLPILSGLVTAYTLYKKRALCLNRCRNERLDREATILKVEAGSEFKYAIPISADQVKGVRVQLPQSVLRCMALSDCVRFFQKPKHYMRLSSDILPGGFKLPHWMSYDPEAHCLTGPIPEVMKHQELVIQILGADDVVLQQCRVQVQAPSAALKPAVTPTLDTLPSLALRS